jgi:hypothetical protein
MEKVIRNGKVAVLVSGGFGAGWYSWNSSHKELLFHPKLVALVEAGKQSEITKEWIEQELGLKNIYCGGARGLDIEWLNEGTAFEVEEYDGSERLRTINDLTLVA